MSPRPSSHGCIAAQGSADSTAGPGCTRAHKVSQTSAQLSKTRFISFVSRRPASEIGLEFRSVSRALPGPPTLLCAGSVHRTASIHGCGEGACRPPLNGDTGILRLCPRCDACPAPSTGPPTPLSAQGQSMKGSTGCMRGGRLSPATLHAPGDCTAPAPNRMTHGSTS